MKFAKSASLLFIGAFIAFALVHYGFVSDPGEGVYYAMGMIAIFWIVTLGERRRHEAEITSQES